MDYRLGSNPCKDCDKRHEGCHVKCSDYQSWSQLRIAYLNSRNKQLQNDIQVTAGMRKCHQKNIKDKQYKRTRKRSRH